MAKDSKPSPDHDSESLARHQGDALEQSVRSVTRLRLPRLRKLIPGTAPGIKPERLAEMPSAPQRAYVSCVDYAPDRVQVTEVLDIKDFVRGHRPDWSKIR